MVKTMRVVDPVGAPNLDLYFRNYDEYFRNLRNYPQHLRRLIAGYSRGDSADELRPAFSVVVEKVAMMQKKPTSNNGEVALVFVHHNEYPEVFRDANWFSCLSDYVCGASPEPNFDYSGTIASVEIH